MKREYLERISEGTNARINRRTLMGSIGAALTGAIAGCTGDGGDGGEQEVKTVIKTKVVTKEGSQETVVKTVKETVTVTPEEDEKETATTADKSGPQVVDQEFVFPVNTPTDSLKNQNAFTAAGHGFSGFFHDQLTYYDVENQKVTPGIVKNWEIDNGNKVILTIDQDYKWSNGDPITAEDLRVTWELTKFIDGYSGYLDSVETLGEFEFQLNLSEKVNPFLLISQQLQRQPNPAKTYGKFVKRFKEAESKEEKNRIIQRLTGTTAEDTESGGEVFKVPVKGPSSPLTSGPFYLDRIGSKAAVGKRNPNYGKAENIKFSTVRGVYYGARQKIWQALREGNADGATALVYMPPDVVKAMPNHVYEAKKPNYAGLSVVPQHRDKWLSKRKVKQALAYVLNSEQMRHNARPRLGKLVEWIHGLPENADFWLGDAAGKLTSYKPRASAQQEARAILEDLGFSEQKDSWITPDGERWTIPVAAATDTSWANAGQTAAQNFQNFGIQSSLSTSSHETHWGDVFTAGNFSGVAIAWHWNGNPHPYWGYYYSLVSPWEHQGYAYPKPPGSENEWQVKAPPVGEPNGSLQTYNIKELVTKAETTVEESAERELFKTIAWIFNQTLPKIQFEWKTKQEWLTSDEWKFVRQGTDDPVWNYVWPAALYWLPRQGKLVPKGTSLED